MIFSKPAIGSKGGVSGLDPNDVNLQIVQLLEGPILLHCGSFFLDAQGEFLYSQLLKKRLLITRGARVFDEPRELIRSIPGVELVELKRNRENCQCCGGGGNLEMIDAKLSSEISKRKLKKSWKPEPKQ